MWFILHGSLESYCGQQTVNKQEGKRNTFCSAQTNWKLRPEWTLRTEVSREDCTQKFVWVKPPSRLKGRYVGNSSYYESKNPRVVLRQF